MSERAKEEFDRALNEAREHALGMHRDRFQTIDLDAPPGAIRPGDMIGAVLEGTGLEAGEPVSKVFGNWCWRFEVDRERWEQEIQPVIKPRIQLLHEQGYIRYGSW